MARWLAAPTGLPPNEWLRRGSPRLLIALALVGAPLFWSGAVRTVFRLSLPVALLAAIPSSAALALAFLPALRSSGAFSKRDRWLFRLGLVAAAVFTFLLLFNRWFGGLVVIVDGDSGTHVALRDQFATYSPGEYAGFVTFYALTWWIERLVPSAFVSFATCFYIAAILYAVLPLCAAITTLQTSRRPRSAFLLVAIVWIAVLYFLAIPLFHYHQSEGFFVHVFGVAPLLALWLADGLVRPPRLRLICFALGIAAYRFTYGLNLGDLLLVAAVIVGLEARACTTRRLAWCLFAVVAFGLVIAARYCYQRLEPLWQLDGWIIPPDLRKAALAEWLLVAVCGLPLVIPSLRARLRGTGIGRLVRVPIAFGAINATVVTWMLWHPPLKIYYLAKYNLHALWLLAAATIVLLAALVGSTSVQPSPSRRRRASVAIVGLAATTIAAGTLWWRAIVVYRPGFLERAWGRPPFRVLHPLADLGAWMRIERVLKHEHKRFGGYLTTYYPVMNFMNAAFGYPNGGIHFYYGRPAIEAPGYCDFWESGPSSSWLEGDFPQRGRRARWEADPERTCVSYPKHWEPEHLRTLCWRCR